MLLFIWNFCEKFSASFNYTSRQYHRYDFVVVISFKVHVIKWSKQQKSTLAFVIGQEMDFFTFVKNISIPLFSFSLDDDDDEWFLSNKNRGNKCSLIWIQHDEHGSQPKFFFHNWPNLYPYLYLSPTKTIRFYATFIIYVHSFGSKRYIDREDKFNDSRRCCVASVRVCKSARDHSWARHNVITT